MADDRHTRIEGCQGLVWSLARQIGRRLPESVELEDLVGYGQLGLAEAARDFDASRGVRFSTYAYYRIRGAIYDGLRKMAWSRPSESRRLGHEALANDVLRIESEASAAETPREGESAVSWFGNVTARLAVLYLTAHTGEEERDGREPADDRTLSPTEHAERMELSARLHEAIERLPARLALLIRATYFEGMTLQEAGELMGMSKSWASRLHARALDELSCALDTVVSEP